MPPPLALNIVDFFGDNLIQILQLGFVGISILLMYMAYRLLNDVVNSEQEIERLKVNRTSIFVFMGFSTLVMAGALLITWNKLNVQPIKVNLAFLPEERDTLDHVRLKISGKSIPLDENGEIGDMELADGIGLIIDINRLSQKMIILEQQKAGLTGQLKVFTTAITDSTPVDESLQVSMQVRNQEMGE